jgi:two-component system, sensor histidine kinase RegB
MTSSIGMAALSRRGVRRPSTKDGTATISLDDSTNKKNLLLLVALRWVAICGQIATIAIVELWLDIPLPIFEMGEVIVFLFLLNLATLYRCSTDTPIADTELFVQLLFDVATLTIQLYLSGGAMNPFISLFLLQVILSAVLLQPPFTWTIVALTGGCFIWLTANYRKIGLAHTHEQRHGSSHFFDLHIHGMFVCFALAAVLLVFLVTRINRNLRDQEARLSQMRQHAVEQEHIVRMGLLASGAAHELSTPLATLSVILQDWERMPMLANVPEIGDDLHEMKSALGRCKEIVSRVLLTAGEIRAERMERTTIVRFLDEAAREWRSLRTPTQFAYCRRIGVDSAIAPDLILKQSLFNVLDNALEASPAWVGLEAMRQDDVLILAVRDKGPGFPPDILARFGKPYRSTKDQPESGLGLFLVVNVLRKLGGSIEPRNCAGGGAIVELKMPIGAMSVEERDGVS